MMFNYDETGEKILKDQDLINTDMEYVKNFERKNIAQSMIKILNQLN